MCLPPSLHMLVLFQMQAATAPLQTLTSKLVKSRHTLHATNLQCEASRAECEKARRQVEANDTDIGTLEDEERKLKLAYVESKLAYEKVHALKHQHQGELKQARVQKLASGKQLESLAGTLKARQCDWTRAHEHHLSREASAIALASKLEAVEKDKEVHRRRAAQHREQVLQYTEMYEALKRELEVINASAESV